MGGLLTVEWMPVIGFEGAIVLTIIAVVSVVLAGARTTSANAGGSTTSTGVTGRLVLRRSVQTKSFNAPANQFRFFAAFAHVAWRVSTAVGVVFKAVLIRFPLFLLRVVSFSFRTQSRTERLARPLDAAVLAVDSESEDRMDDGVKTLDDAAQWSKITKVVDDGISKAHEIEELHEAAARQLDAVDYAYERMLVELRDVLPNVLEAQSVCRTNRDEAYAEMDAAACAVDAPAAEGDRDFDEREQHQELLRLARSSAAGEQKPDQSVAA